ncbi:hypothetical protein MKW94_017170 [Papaver nudicaule]|uniref:DOG1 domain-containing protein n=1 Tax=Papaver nudicaule TaxID=74823 RepID=A0AA41VRL7_PAPNU|nr:hypothetical protein [Papaver nudicaule]
MVSPAELLSTHVQMLHHHFQTYYQTLDLAASEDVSQLLFPNWHNSLQKPFLWFGDFHPNIFTNLLRSLLNTDTDDEEEDYPLVWKYPSTNLMSKVEEMECSTRLILPGIMNRYRASQSGFIEKVGYDWIHSSGKSEILKAVSGDVMAQMEELVSVFLDANRLRRSILTEIISATDVYQSALYLQALAEFFTGFSDHEFIKEFEQCKVPLSVIP